MRGLQHILRSRLALNPQEFDFTGLHPLCDGGVLPSVRPIHHSKATVQSKYPSKPYGNQNVSCFRSFLVLAINEWLDGCVEICLSTGSISSEGIL